MFCFPFSQTLTGLGLISDIFGAFFLARANGMWQEVFGLKKNQREGFVGRLLLCLFESRGPREKDCWWKVDSFRGFVLLILGFLLQLIAVIRP